jgi:hypothetical protein
MERYPCRRQRRALAALLVVLAASVFNVWLRPPHPIDGMTVVGLVALLVLIPLAVVGPPDERIPR